MAIELHTRVRCATFRIFSRRRGRNHLDVISASFSSQFVVKASVRDMIFSAFLS